LISISLYIETIEIDTRRCNDAGYVLERRRALEEVWGEGEEGDVEQLDEHQACVPEHAASQPDQQFRQ